MRKAESLKNKWLVLPGLIVLAVVTTMVFHYLNSSRAAVIPDSIRKKAAFQLYVPDTSTKKWNLPQNTVSYDSTQGLLSFTAVSSDNSLYITEENTPSQFNDIPQYYPALLGKLNEYSEIQTNLGTVALTHPKELNGGQTAIVNSHGTLVFIRPSKNLSDSDWQQFINSLRVIK